MAPETRALCRQAVAVVIAKAESGARRPRKPWWSITRSAGGRRRSLGDQAGSTATAPEAPGNVVYEGRWRRGRRERAFAKATNVVTLELTNNRGGRTRWSRAQRSQL